MPDVLVRNLSAAVVKRLKRRAKANGRSLQGEAKLVLERSAAESRPDVSAMLQRWRKQFAGRRLVPSADLIREGRDR